MEKEEFNKLLKEADLSQKELSNILKTSNQAINNWGSNDREIPYWVKSWLENYIKAKVSDKIINVVKPFINDKNNSSK